MWEREPTVGVNERRFTLDQSHKLECKLDAGLQSMVEGQCIMSRFILQELNFAQWFRGGLPQDHIKGLLGFLKLWAWEEPSQETSCGPSWV